MSLPNGGHRENVIRTKAFETYIRDNIANWFSWAQRNDLGVDRMEDIILVSGCTLVTSWAAAAFVDNNSVDNTETEISLASNALSNGGASFAWNKIKGSPVYHNSRFDPVRFPGYVYSACADLFLFLCCLESKIHPRLRISASFLRASERSAASSGSNTSVLQQNPVLMTLTTPETMRYK